ncbi:MAG: hypothetical protein C4519_23490 [Desulfobacteraceae bacterium]|nr:MAG: hypothetical protein C4519_23490 [Desulfobacteraceae bacterium]
MSKRTKSTYLLLLLLGAVVLGMLYFGFRLKGFRPANSVRWAAEGPGISFEQYGIAYTDPIDMASAGERGFSLEIAIQPEKIGGGFHFVLLAHDGDDARQLLIGQWRSTLIVMHGADYENRRKTPKIIVDIGKSPDKALLVSIASGAKGTQLFLNGALKKENPALRLQWPASDQGAGARLVLGNSVYGHSSWRGAIAGLAVYAHRLSPFQVRRHYAGWRERGDFGFAKPDAPEMLFLLDEGTGELARDQSGNGYHLTVPAYMRILKKEVLLLPWHMGRAQWNYGKDAILNFIGFWPLGFLVAAALDRGRRIREYYRPAAILICFMFSLSIEMGQVWIPSRSSSLLDLILNTSGAGVGTLLFARQRRWFALNFFGER